MFDIREILSGLDDTKRAAIMEAFDTRKSHVIVYQEGRFIGVHLDHPANNLTVMVRHGAWCAGIAT